MSATPTVRILDYNPLTDPYLSKYNKRLLKKKHVVKEMVKTGLVSAPTRCRWCQFTAQVSATCQQRWSERLPVRVARRCPDLCRDSQSALQHHASHRPR